MSTRALAQAVRPTSRAVAWSPVLVLSAGLLAVATLLHLQDATSPTVVTLGAGAMAAALVLGWRDPAAALLAPVPVPRLARRAIRLGLVAALAVPVWLVVTGLLGDEGRALAPLLALTAAGAAVATWRPDEADLLPVAGGLLVWATLAVLLDSVSGPVGAVATAWVAHPWAVLAVALAAVAVGRHR